MKVSALLLIVLVFTLLSFSPTLAAVNITHAVCTNTTLSTFYKYTAADGIETNDTQQSICPFECNSVSGLCNPDPYTSDAGLFFFLFPIISFILLYFSNMLKEQDWPIHLLLTASALLFIVVPLGQVSGTLGSFTWLYYLSVVTFVIVMIYYVLRVFVKSFQTFHLGGK